jgi:hypothetical protein
MSMLRKAKLVSFGVFLIAASMFSTVKADIPDCGTIYDCETCPRDIVGSYTTTASDCSGYAPSNGVWHCTREGVTYSVCSLEHCS